MFALNLVVAAAIAGSLATTAPVQYRSTGTVRAVARVVDTTAARAAETSASSLGENLRRVLGGQTDERAGAGSLDEWIRVHRGEHAVGGGAVHLDVVRPAASEAPVLLIEWTSN